MTTQDFFTLKSPWIFAVTSPIIQPILEKLLENKHQIRIHQSFENAYKNFEATILDFEAVHIFLLNADSPDIKAEIQQARQFFSASIAVVLYSATQKSSQEIICLMKYGADEYLEIPDDPNQFYTLLETKFNTLFQDPIFKDHQGRYVQFRQLKEAGFRRILSSIYYELLDFPELKELYKKEKAKQKYGSALAELKALLQFLQIKTKIILPPREKPVVLVVDDEIMTLENLKLLLEDHFTILQAKNAFEAVNICKTQDIIDIVLLDIMMPGDKTTILPFLKKIKPKAEFMILTAYDDHELISEAIRKGAIDYLVKNKSLNKRLIKKIQDVADKVYYDTMIMKILDRYSACFKKHRVAAK